MNLEEKLYREDLKLASIERRVLAFLVDKFIISFVFMMIYWGKFAQVLGDYSRTIEVIQSVFWQFFILSLLYEVIFSVLYGATLGKLLVKIKILSTHFLDYPSIFPAFLRALLKIIGESLLYAPYFLAFFLSSKQALHDYFAKTIVVDNA